MTASGGGAGDSIPIGVVTNLPPDFLGYHMLPDDQKKLIQMVRYLYPT